MLDVISFLDFLLLLQLPVVLLGQEVFGERTTASLSGGLLLLRTSNSNRFEERMFHR